MKAFLFSIALLLLTSGCGDDGGAGAGGAGGMAGVSGDDPSATCAQLCTTVAAVHCPNDTTCMQDCLGLWNDPTCATQARALIQCTVAVPANQWACDSVGEAEPTSACVGELSAVGSCFNGQM